MSSLLRSKILFAFVIIGLIGLIGCSKGGGESNNQDSVPTASNQEIRTITDDLGRSVVIPANPKRVLALTKNMMDELYELGVTPVGKVEEYNNVAELIALPSVSNQATPNIEAIYQLKPDIILANTRQHSQIKAGLEASNAAIIFIDPSKVKQDPLVDEIVFLGEILGRQTQAQAYVQTLDKLSQELQTKIAAAGYHTGLFLQAGGDTISAAQPTGVYGALLPRLGIQNIVPSGLPGSDKSTWVAFDAETIVNKDPDLIMIKAASNDKNEQESIRTAFMQNPAWKELKAVKTGNVFVIPAKISPGSISNEEALRATAKIIYPAGY